MSKLNKILLISFLSSIILLNGCADDPAPSLYESIIPDVVSDPIIVSITPQLEALAGISVVTLTGSNFSSTLTDNDVYFNGVAAELISGSPTELVVKVPNVIADSVGVKIKVHKAANFSNQIQYKLISAVTEPYIFNALLGEIPYSATVNRQDEMFVSIYNNGVKKIIDGEISNFAPKGTESYFNSLKVGPDNNIYATRRAKGIILVQENTAPATFISAGIQRIIVDLDFDVNNNIWAVCDSNVIYRVTLDKQIKSFAFSGRARACKITGEYLYVASFTDFQEKILRFKIFSQDSLGAVEEYFNFSNLVDPILKINDIAISQDGDIFIGTNKFVDPIYFVRPDKTFDILYPGIINSAVSSLAYGVGNFLYMSNIEKDEENQDVYKTVLKINMQKSGVY